ncbi:MAG: hypothetical protein H7A34_04585 [bacterium]|nr:hypothetical protein [bacterium]
MNPQTNVTLDIGSWFFSRKRSVWKRIVVFLMIESILFGQNTLIWAQSPDPTNDPLPKELDLPSGETDFSGNGENVEETPFMPSVPPPINIGPENPFFQTEGDNDIPGAGQEGAGNGNNDQNQTSYGLEEVITIDESLRIDLADRSELPRYKVRFTLENDSTFFNTGFEDISSVTKPGGGYIYTENLLSLSTQNGDLKLVYSFYREEDGVIDEGTQSIDVVTGYQFGVEYTAEFQITLTSIRTYVYETSQGRQDDPDLTIQGLVTPEFYAVTNNNAQGNISLEIFKQIQTGYQEVDLNNDGITDAFYDNETGIWGIDVDGDGVPDGQGIDTDNDGIPDQFRNDTDGDGLADADPTSFEIDLETNNFNVTIPKKDRTVIDESGTLTIYDNEGNVLETIASGGSASQVQNFPDGSRRVTSTDPDGNQTIQVFDNDDNLITQTIKLFINGALQEPGTRTLFEYLPDNDSGNVGGEIRTEYNDVDGDGVKDPEDSPIARAVLSSNQNLISITAFDTPRDGDLTIQKFDGSGVLSSITIDESAARGDGFTIQRFYPNGNLNTQTTHNGLTGDEVRSLFSLNGRLTEQTSFDNDTGTQTVSYFSYGTDPTNVGRLIRRERLNHPVTGLLRSRAILDSIDNSLINITTFDDSLNPVNIAEFDKPQEGFVTNHSLRPDGSELLQVFDAQSRLVLLQEIAPDDTVLESTVYQYSFDNDTKQNFRTGYVDTNTNGILDGGETLKDEIAELDNFGDLINLTSFAPDGTTIESITEFNKPLFGYLTSRQVNQPEGKSTIQVIDFNSQLVALQTLTSPFGDYTDPGQVEESTVFEYDTNLRAGYVDDNKNQFHETGETKLSSIAELDNDGNFITITTFADDGVTVESITEFNWPLPDYTATRIIDNDGDTVQVSDNEGRLSALMTLTGTLVDYKVPANVVESTVFVYDGSYRWGYVDDNKNAQKESGETKVSSVAELDNAGNIVTVTSYETTA